MSQGQSYPINFLRRPDNFDADPFTNNLSTNNPSYPYSSIFSALFAAFGAAFWITVLSGLGFNVRTKAAATYYVATNGNDASDGLTPATAWLTLAHASAILFGGSLDFAGQIVTLQAVAGHAAFTDKLHVTPWVGGGGFIYDGGGGSIAVTVDKAILVDGGALPGPFTYQNVALSATHGIADPNSGRGVDIISPSTVHQGAGVSFGACAGGYHIFAGTGAFLNLDANYSITSGANQHWGAGNAALIFIQSAITITLTGTPAFAGAFALAVLGGTLFVGSALFSGAATGVRYSATLNGVIFTSNGGANFFPGNAAGSTATGGQYS